MASRYREITHTAMAAHLESIGFFPLNLNGCVEYVWQRNVESKQGKQYPYAVRVYSSVDKRTGLTRDCGSDAIRVVLMDLKTGRALKLKSGKGKAGQRIYRTQNALPTLTERCREYFSKVIHDGCPKCGSVMAERGGRNGKFLGCTKYPACNGTKQLES